MHYHGFLCSLYVWNSLWLLSFPSENWTVFARAGRQVCGTWRYFSAQALTAAFPPTPSVPECCFPSARVLRLQIVASLIGKKLYLRVLIFIFLMSEGELLFMCLRTICLTLSTNNLHFVLNFLLDYRDTCDTVYIFKVSMPF